MKSAIAVHVLWCDKQAALHAPWLTAHQLQTLCDRSSSKLVCVLTRWQGQREGAHSWGVNRRALGNEHTTTPLLLSLLVHLCPLSATPLCVTGCTQRSVLSCLPAACVDQTTLPPAALSRTRWPCGVPQRRRCWVVVVADSPCGKKQHKRLITGGGAGCVAVSVCPITDILTAAGCGVCRAHLLSLLQAEGARRVNCCWRGECAES